MVVPAYACATRCPVLTHASCPRACYEMSGTDIAYGATRRRTCKPLRPPSRRSTPLSAYALATRCPVLTWAPKHLRACYAMSGTDIGYYAPTRERMKCPILTQSRVLCTSALATRCPVLTWCMVPFCLRACYTLPGTDVEYLVQIMAESKAEDSLSWAYAASNGDVMLRSVSGHVPYVPTSRPRCPCYQSTRVLCEVRY
eukprot:3170587-Rhodomonas_salina.2